MSIYFSTPFLPSKIVRKLQNAPVPNGYTSSNIRREVIPHLNSNMPHPQRLQNQLIDYYRTINFFKELGLNFVSNEMQDPGLLEIKISEAKYYYKLFNTITEENTSIKFENDPHFKTQCLAMIKHLLARPSGRYLIDCVCQGTLPTILKKGEDPKVIPGKKNIQVILNFDISHRDVQIDQNGTKKLGIFCPSIILAHELIHVVQRHLERKLMLELRKSGQNEKRIKEQKAFNKLTGSLTSCYHYTNFCEMIAIEGLDKDDICENRIRCEFGYPKRFGHCTTKFPPINLNDPNDDPNAIDPTLEISRIFDAAFIGIEEEVFTLLSMKADLQEAMLGAARGGNLSLLKRLVENYGANIEASSSICEFQERAAHKAAACGQIEILKYLDDIGSDLSICDNIGYTPLHTACDCNQIKSIEYLIQKKVQINTLTADIHASPLDFLLMENRSMKSIKMLLDAGAKMGENYEKKLSSSYDSLEPKIKKRFEFVRSYFAQKGDFGVIENENPRPKRKRPEEGDVVLFK